MQGYDGGICAVLQQEPARLHVPLTARTVQGGLAQAVKGVDLGAVLQEQLHQVVVPLVRRQVQGREEVLVLLVQLRALPQQRLHQAAPLAAAAARHGAMQGGVQAKGES